MTFSARILLSLNAYKRPRGEGHGFFSLSPSPSQTMPAQQSCLNFPSKALDQPASIFSSSLLSPRAWATSFGIRSLLIYIYISNYLFLLLPARSSILSVLDDAIVNGHLTISDPEGTHYYGKFYKGCNDVRLKVINHNFWLRILLQVASLASDHTIYTHILLRSGDLGCMDNSQPDHNRELTVFFSQRSIYDW